MVLPQDSCISGTILTFYKNVEKINGYQNFDIGVRLIEQLLFVLASVHFVISKTIRNKEKCVVNVGGSA